MRNFIAWMQRQIYGKLYSCDHVGSLKGEMNFYKTNKVSCVITI